MEFAVTLVQTPCYEGDRNRNFEGTRAVLEEPRTDVTPHFILLPELFAIGFRHSDYEQQGPGVPGVTSDFLCSLAEEQSAYVIGTGIERQESKFLNTLVVASPDGTFVGTYSKIHPFKEERDVFVGGKKIAMFEIGGMNVGVEICYDVRFPEVSRALALAGAELILVPAAFPDPRSAHWDTLVAARAIENQLYVAATNRVGPSFEEKTYFGHSQVVDPWGVRLTRVNSEVDVFTSVCDTSAIKAVREQITCYVDRAPSAYDDVVWFKE
ncbi:MAG: carbon-nitrogen family hydrolase [Candidatus Thorarchaeota archaeon]|nr:MAG: carbon-nitrogen family hydrolase [Candidatus Thorarchaeota archaeon]